MRRTVILAVFLIIAGFGSVCQAVPPRAPSLRDAWQELNGKCGRLVEKNETWAYEFFLDEISPQEGTHCVASIGTDVIMFGPNAVGALFDSPKQYLIVPMERIVLRIRQ